MREKRTGASRRRFLSLVGATTALTGVEAASATDGHSVPEAVIPARTRNNLAESDETWSQQTKLIPTDGDESDRFGGAVAMSGETAVIAAPFDEGQNGEDVGSAYVFSESGDEWTQQTKLTPDDGVRSAVALSGETAVIGALGSAYVLSGSDGEWTQQTKLTAGGGEFGSGVALSGETAVVGSPWDEDSNGEEMGSAYVFDGSGGEWTQQAKLTADDGDSRNSFGYAVGLSGETAVIGAYMDEEGAGSAYVFDGSGGEWTQQAKLTADDGDSDDNFGRAVAVSGETAVIGALWDEDPNGEEAGSAYMFSGSGDEWTQQTKLIPDDGDSDDDFGISVAVDGATAVIGASGEENPNGGLAGSAYVFSGSGSEWTQQAKLASQDGNLEDRFGSAVALDGKRTIIGTPGDEDPNGIEAGSAYVFKEGRATETSTTPAPGATDENKTTAMPPDDETDSQDQTADDSTDDQSDGSGPGLGILSALSGVAGIAYLLRRRQTDI